MLRKRLRWMAIGAAFSYLSKRKTARDIDRATAELGERLPDPVRRVVDALPGDLQRVGGAALVARSNAATAARTTVTVSRAARTVSRTPRHVRGRLRAARDGWANEIELERRRLTSDVLRATHGEAAALDALLDLRSVDDGPLPEPKLPIRQGRWRHRPSLPPLPVARVQRTYLPPASSRSPLPRNRSTDH